MVANKKYILLDKEIYEKLEKKADRKKISIGKIIESLLEERLNRNDKDIKTLEKVIEKIENVEGRIEKISKY